MPRRSNRRFKFQKSSQFFIHERLEPLWIFMLDRSLALGLEIGPWAASGEDSSMD